MIGVKTGVTILIGLMMSTACSENSIRDGKTRVVRSKSDEMSKIDRETSESISFIAGEATNSSDILTCEHGKNLIHKGMEVLPYLKEKFTDPRETTVYSSYNKRNLTFGELAIIIASEIKHIPIAYVVGIQQCTPPFDMEIEHYLGNIKANPVRFLENYDKWLKEEM